MKQNRLRIVLVSVLFLMSLTALTACGHQHQMKAHEAVEATCTTGGNSAYWECPDCGKYFSDEAGTKEIAKDSWVVAAKGHNLTAHEAVEATCTTGGNSAYWECPDCGKYFSDEAGTKEIAKDSWVIAAKGHNLTVHEAVAATCTVGGNSAYWECPDCEKCFSDEAGTKEIAKDSWVIAAKGHNLTAHEAVAATCTTGGNSAYWECPDCGKYFSDEAGTKEIGKDSWVVTAKGHNLTAHEAVDETCTTDGNSAYWECPDCGKYFSDEAGTNEIEEKSWVIAAQHDYQLKETITASCASVGMEHYACSRCEEEYFVKTGDRLAHTFGEDGRCTACNQTVADAYPWSIESPDERSVIVGDETYGYLVHAYDSTSYVQTITVGRDVLEEAIRQGYYGIRIQFGSPDASYRIFGYKLPGQSAVKYLNCYTFNGFGPTAFVEIQFADSVNGMYSDVVSETGIQLEIFYRFAGNETISSEEAANNAGKYLGSLGKYILNLTYDHFDPTNAATYVMTKMSVEGSGNTLTLGGSPTGSGYTVTISAKVIDYWMKNGMDSISFRFSQKEGQTLALRLMSLPNFATPYDSNYTLTVRDYKLTEAMRQNGLNIGIYFREINNHNDQVDGMIFTVIPNRAANPEDPSTWILTDYTVSAYDSETVKTILNGIQDNDQRLVMLRGSIIAAMMEQGYTQVKFILSKVNSNQTPYLKASGDIKGEKNNSSLTIVADLTEDFAANGIRFDVQYSNLTLQNPAWGGKEPVSGFGLTVEFIKPEA